MRVSPPRLADTVFVGGGTPGVLSAVQLAELCGIVGGAGGEGILEWSVELAPAEVTEEKLRMLKSHGVTRISLGVQTFDPMLLAELGRNHPPDKALRAYDLIRSVGFPSVNIDLLFGSPGQSLDAWEYDIRRAVELQPDHISTYCLTFEEDTVLYARLSKGELRIDLDREAAFYEFAWEYLPSAGYEQYEVSNYARPGKQCLHNLNTWRMNEWIGYGPSASSQFRGTRYRNIADLETWVGSLAAGQIPCREDEETLTPADLARDSVLFGLRLNAGFDLDEITTRFDLPANVLTPIRSYLTRLVVEDLAERVGESFRLLPSGRILSDALAAELPDLPLEVAGL